MLHLSSGGRKLLAFSSATLIAMGLLAGLSAGSSAHPSHKAAHWSHGGGGGGAGFTVQSWSKPGDPAGVNLWTLTNGRGMSVAITNYGATVQAINVPDKWGKTRNVALGFPTLADYVSDFTQGATQKPWPLPGGSGNTFFGATIGRYANRIAGASFTMTCSSCSNNGKTYTLDANNGTNTLHGGYLGWNTQVWTGNASTSGHDVSLALTHNFPAGEGCLIPPSTSCTGYPAPVMATVTYTLTRNNALKIAYNVVNTASAGGDATVINLTNHTYFNLGGEASGSVFDQLLQLNANQYQPVNTGLIPQGFASVAGTAFDFTHLKPIGQDIRDPTPDNGLQPFPQLVIAHGYDHNFVLNGGSGPAAIAEDPSDGITMWTYTTEPGVQLYTGNFLVGDLTGTSGHTYRQTDAFTLETQHFPDSPNHIGDPAWPSVVLNAGNTFTSSTTYQFSAGGHGHDAHNQR